MFLVLAFDRWYPRGGMHDCLGQYDDEDAARLALMNNTDRAIGHVVNLREKSYDEYRRDATEGWLLTQKGEQYSS